MKYVDRILENPGRSIKQIAKVLFICCLIVALISLIIGSVWLLQHYSAFDDIDEVLRMTLIFSYDDLRDWIGGETAQHIYLGRELVMNAVRLALASLAFIPLYGFGCMVEDTAALKKKLCHSDDDAEER